MAHVVFTAKKKEKKTLKSLTECVIMNGSSTVLEHNRRSEQEPYIGTWEVWVAGVGGNFFGVGVGQEDFATLRPYGVFFLPKNAY